MNDRVATAMQVVGDGIAWRTLGYRRAYIRLLSENRDSGHLSTHELDTFQRILLVARDMVLINDLTRCLRIAGLTVVRKDGTVILVESKKSGRSFKDAGDILAGLSSGPHAPSKQNLRHLIAQFAFTDRQIVIPLRTADGMTEERYDIVDIGIPVCTHLKTVGRLIREAKRRGFAIAQLEPGYLVSVTAFERFAAREEAFQRMFEQYKAERDKQEANCLGDDRERVMRLTTYDALMKEDGHFPRNSVPISILPFSDSDCAELMLGFIKIDTALDLNRIKTRLEARGWRVQELLGESPGRAAGDPAQGDLTAYGPRAWEEFLRLEREFRGATYFSTLPITLVIGMVSGFYGVDFLCDMEEAQFESSKQDRRNRAVVVNFAREGRVLR